MTPRTTFGEFARHILHRPLYPYQELIGNAILDSVLNRRGLTFTVMLARQMGKNQLSAILEAYLLYCMESGTMVKAAPTFQPQIINSRLRLLSMLDTPFTRGRTWKSYGYIVGVAPTAGLRDTQEGPRIMFFSAGPESNIVGATASLLLEIDEAQDVDIEKYDRDLRPMASTTNATTILYGTAWTGDTLLATLKAANQQLEERDGIRRHFEFDWTTLAALNPDYRRFVKNEMRRLGEDHVTIRTQYRLQPISGAGFLLNDLQRYLLRGEHDWLASPEEDEAQGCLYIASMDIGGEERRDSGSSVDEACQQTRAGRQDSTVITIARVVNNEVGLSRIEIVHQVWWTGKSYMEQYAATRALCERWHINRLVVDRTGLGEVMVSWLEAAIGSGRVIPFHFSRTSKSSLAYQLLGMINGGRLRLYRQDKAPRAIHDECWQQLRLARYRVPGANLLDMYVTPSEGHDDFLMSIALCCEAIKSCPPATQETGIIRPRKLYIEEGWY